MELDHVACTTCGWVRVSGRCRRRIIEIDILLLLLLLQEANVFLLELNLLLQ